MNDVFSPLIFSHTVNNDILSLKDTSESMNNYQEAKPGAFGKGNP